MHPKKIPSYVSEERIIILWTMDEFLPVVVILFIGFLTNTFGISLLCAAIALKYYRKFRDGRPKGYFLHLLWRLGFVSIKGSHVFFNPFIRRFIAR